MMWFYSSHLVNTLHHAGNIRTVGGSSLLASRVHAQIVNDTIVAMTTTGHASLVVIIYEDWIEILFHVFEYMFPWQP